MDRFFTRLQRMRDDDAGAVAVDWVALSSLILILGLAAIYGIFGQGMRVMMNELDEATIGTAAINFAPETDENGSSWEAE